MLKTYFKRRLSTPAWVLSLLLISIPLWAGASNDVQSASQSANAVSILNYIAPSRNGTIDLTLVRDGSDVVVRDGNIVVRRVPMTLVSAIEIGGPDRTDTTLTIDYSFGPIAVPIDYHPGALGPLTDNLLNLRGSNYSEIAHNPLGPHDGIITLDNVPVRYSNLTPITDTTPAVNYTFNAFPSGADNISISDGPVISGYQTMQIGDGGTYFETTDIANKTSVTFNLENYGSVVTVNNPTLATGMTSFTINGEQGAVANGASTFNITPSSSLPIAVNGNLDSGTPTDSLIVDVTGATNVHITAHHGASGYSGTYTFGNRQTVTFTQMASISPAPETPSIPTLSEWGMIILSSLLAFGAVFSIRRQRQ